MGLFDTQKKVKVGTSVARVIEDDLLPNAVKTGLITALFEGTDLTDNVLEEMVGSIGVRAERMYEYAKRRYSYGLPSGSVQVSTQGTPAVQAVLNELEHAWVTLKYCRFGPINLFHAGWLSLTTAHGYDPATNQLAALTAAKGRPVYLEDMQLILSPALQAQLSPAVVEQWGPPATAGYSPTRPSRVNAVVAAMAADTSIIVDPLVTAEEMLVTVSWEEPAPPDPENPHAASVLYKTETFTIPLDGYDADADYFQVKYDVNGVIKYWLYQVGNGTYPTLDAVFDDPPPVTGTYFPFLYFRFGKQSMETLEGTDEYKTSKRLAKYLGIDYADMIEAIHENPDIDDVEQAMLTFAVRPDSTDPIELRYLYDYFAQQYQVQSSGGLSAAADRIRAELGQNPNGSRSSHLTVIQDNRFKMTLGHNGIYKRTTAGQLGPIGTVQGSYRTLEETYEYLDAETGQTTVYRIETPIHVYQRQLTDALVEELEVHNLRMTYFVSGRYTTTGSDTEDILLVPIDRSIAEDYSIPVREQLYARAMHFVFNSKVTIKLKWYEQEWFSAVLIIAAIVITIISLGTYGPAAAAYIAAIAAGTVALSAVVIGVLLAYVLPALLMALAVKLFVKAVGPEGGLIAAVVMVAAAMYGVVDASAMASAPTWAQNLLQVATNLASAAGDLIQDQMVDLLGEFEDFNLFVKEQNDLLEKANDLLETKSWLSPMVIFGEKPEDFYNRTVHSGNIGLVGISAIGSFVDVALTLPTLHETIGANFNGIA